MEDNETPQVPADDEQGLQPQPELSFYQRFAVEWIEADDADRKRISEFVAGWYEE